MATHTSIFAWKIQWIEEPGRPQFLGLQTIGHNFVTDQACTTEYYKPITLIKVNTKVLNKIFSNLIQQYFKKISITTKYDLS